MITLSQRRMFHGIKRYTPFYRFILMFQIGGSKECWNWQGAVHTKTGYGRFIWPEKHIVTAHAAAYEMFIGQRNSLMVCHSCDNKICVNPAHLWLGTAKQNTADMILKGRMYIRKPQETHTVKLTWKEAREIRRLHLTGEYSRTQLAEKFGVGGSNISYILRGKIWKE